MDLATAKMIPKSRLLATLAAIVVSKEHGTRTIEKLESDRKISPLHTPTGRELLSFEDAQTVLNAFPRAKLRA